MRLRERRSTQGDVVAGYIDALGCQDGASNVSNVNLCQGPSRAQAFIPVERYPHQKMVPCPVCRRVSIFLLLLVRWAPFRPVTCTTLVGVLVVMGSF